MKELTLISWNVNGIRAAVLKGFEDFLKNKKPDILGLQEIKITDEARAKVSFDFSGYQEFWNPAARPGYSGTAILIKDGLEPIKIKYGIGKKEFDEEGRVVTAEFAKFYFVNCYFPNSNHELSRLDYKIKFNREFLKYIKKLEKTKPVITCGDFNVAHQEIDLKNPKENMGGAGFTNEERAGMDKFLAAGLIDTFRLFYPKKIKYSWWTYRFKARERNIGWRLDYFLASKKIKNKLSNAFILDKVMGSDHCPVGIKIKM